MGRSRAALAALALAGCRDPTEVTVELTTDLRNAR